MSSERKNESLNTGDDHKVCFVRSRKRFKVYTWKYKKTISPTASFILLVSQIFGFGMNGIPSIMREGGWLPVLLANLGVCIVAALCSLMLLRAMTLIPHNDNFDQRIEYNTLVKYYLSDCHFRLVSVLHHMGDLCSVICGILTFSKLLDMLLVQMFGCTLAIQVYPSFKFGKADFNIVSAIYEFQADSGTDGPNSFTLAMTLGYVFCAALCLRLSACALEETMGFHLVSFVAMIGCSIQLALFSLKRFFTGIRFEMPPKIGKGSFSTILLTFVDNYSLASTTPSWANEMTVDVKVVPTLWISAIFACVVYHILGFLFCVGFPTNSGSAVNDILMGKSGAITNASICLFVAVTVLPDVVFGSISTKYNILNLGYCGEIAAYLWGCVFPFMFTWLLSNENMFMEIINYISLVSALVCDFAIPAILYAVACEREQSIREEMEQADSKVSGSEYFRAKDILFSNIASLKRKITGITLTKLHTELKEPVKQESAKHELAERESAEQEPLEREIVEREPSESAKCDVPVDYLSFKIIRAPNKPRYSDFQYNVLAPRKRISTVSFGDDPKHFPLEEVTEEPEAKEMSSPSQIEKKSANPRVSVFPFHFMARNHLITYLILIALGGLTIFPPLVHLIHWLKSYKILRISSEY